MHPPTASTLAWLGIIPLLAWRVLARFRSMVGRQRLSKWRPWVTLTVFPLLLLALCFAAQAHPLNLLWLAGGFWAGALLALEGLRRTDFEPTPQRLFYTPHAKLGVALTLLFVARVGYRLVEVILISPTAPHGWDDFARSAVTLAIFGLLAGYRMAYAVGLAAWRCSVLNAKRRREALAAGNATAPQPVARPQVNGP